MSRKRHLESPCAFFFFKIMQWLQSQFFLVIPHNWVRPPNECLCVCVRPCLHAFLDMHPSNNIDFFSGLGENQHRKDQLLSSSVKYNAVLTGRWGGAAKEEHILEWWTDTCRDRKPHQSQEQGSAPSPLLVGCPDTLTVRNPASAMRKW